MNESTVWVFLYGLSWVLAFDLQYTIVRLRLDIYCFDMFRERCCFCSSNCDVILACGMLVVEVLLNSLVLRFNLISSCQRLLFHLLLHCSLMANSAMYLIFAVSSQTLHLRYCCKNTGKQSLRKRFPPSWLHDKNTCDKMLTCVFHMYKFIYASYYRNVQDFIK